MKTALIVTALIAAPALFTRPVAAADLTVTITDIRATQGQVMVALLDSEAAWNGTAKPVAGQAVAASGNELKLTFANLPAGHYAVRVMHDENGNGKLDTNAFGMPTEGYGFSNNPNVMRRPNFDEVRFVIGETAANVVVRLR
jgi:uncharacterized protein (DUF2141 family)